MIDTYKSITPNCNHTPHLLKHTLFLLMLSLPTFLQAQQKNTTSFWVQVNTTLNAGHTFWPNDQWLSFIDIQPRGYMIQDVTKWALIFVLWVSPSQEQISAIWAREHEAHTPYIFGGVKMSWALSYWVWYQFKPKNRRFGVFTEIWMSWKTPFYLNGIAIPLTLKSTKI